MIKNILFDFGRTLVEHPEDGAGRRIIEESGIKNEQDIIRVQKIIFNVEKYLNRLDENSLEREEYKKLLKFELEERFHQAIPLIADYNINKLPLLKDTLYMLKKLKQDGYRLFITSNLDLLHASQMENHEIAKYFDGMVFSSQIGVRKPFREFFETALEKFGVNAEECIFIDDLKENVDGGERCGIKGFVFNDNAQEAIDFIYGTKG
ncbi:MAG: HAD family phosphatase [Clostridia bacterium]|nr:HAD family phosphatase [Clostridia bacterium]